MKFHLQFSGYLPSDNATGTKLIDHLVHGFPASKVRVLVTMFFDQGLP